MKTSAVDLKILRDVQNGLNSRCNIFWKSDYGQKLQPFEISGRYHSPSMRDIRPPRSICSDDKSTSARVTRMQRGKRSWPANRRCISERQMRILLVKRL